MPLTPPNFTAVEVLGFPSQVILTDTSIGSDVTINGRRVFFQLADGTYLVQAGTTTNYELWAIANLTITLDLIPKSQAVFVTVQWMNGTTVVDEKLILYGFNLYDYLFGYEKVQVLTAKPKLIDDVNFYNSMVKLDVNIFCEEIAITIGDDIYSSQEAMDRNKYLIDHQITFF